MNEVLATVSNVNKVVEKIGYDVAFPNLGIFIKTLKNSIVIGNFTIAYYGIIIAIAMIVGFLVGSRIAKKDGVNEDHIYDLFILIIILGIVGARAYYVIFNWDYYQIRPYEIINLRAGGLAIFGGLIACTIGVIAYCKIKKCDFIAILDAAAPGAAIGQAIGRYGNFFNMEAFGTYTNNLLAMRLRYEYLDPSNVDLTQLANIIVEDGVQYIQAHPTFFYESTLNIILFAVLILIYKKFRFFKGQLFATYLIGYGIIRFFVESLRTDSLAVGMIRVSQVVAVISLVIGIVIYVINLRRMKS